MAEKGPIVIQPEEDEPAGNINVRSESQAPQEESNQDAPCTDAYGKGENIALIIDNDTVVDSFQRRPGSNADFMQMYRLLHELGFESIKSCIRLTCSEIRSKLKEVSESKYTKKVGCFVCVILSLGGEGCVYGTDYDGKDERNVVGVLDIMDYFKSAKCTSFIDVPKLFFIQTYEPKPKEQRDGEQGPEVSFPITSMKIPVEADQLLVHSYIPVDRQRNDSKKYEEASCFISELTPAIRDGMNPQEDLDLLSTLSLMNGRIAETMGDKCKLPYTSSTLRKDVHLH